MPYSPLSIGVSLAGANPLSDGDAPWSTTPDRANEVSPSRVLAEGPVSKKGGAVHVDLGQTATGAAMGYERRRPEFQIVVGRLNI